VLSVQPLVENAVKHGVSAKAGGGEVRLSARVSNGALRVTVSDTGAGFGPGALGGVGLDNVRRRLQICYGPEARLHLASSVDGASASFSVPLETRG
jgi:sensor histidine kinase YesM